LAEHPAGMASPHTEEPPTKGTADPDRMELSQRLAVEELITTEASYVHNLQLCLSDIRAHLQQKQLPDFDLEGLFSNIDDILHLSRQFLRGLEATAAQEHDQLLGTLFQEFKEEMETVYKIYCASYEHALLLVESYRKDPRLQEEIMDTLNATVPHTSASDLSFFLVMPVQRITKYPLLLGKILENTPAGTSTHQALAAAVSAMAQANANINEYKRQREVATKYNKAEHLTLRDRLARLNTHSIAKKTTRLSRLLMHEAGFVSKTEDKEYDNLEEKFQSVASSVAGLKENVASYMAHLEAFLVPAPHKRELQMEEGPAQQYHRLAEHLHRAVFPEFKRRLDRLVWQPLCSLSEMLVGPQQLVKKRLDKLLDYEEIQERKSELGSVTYDEEAAMNTYLAINALLVAELPRFNQVAVQLLGQVLGSLCVLHQDLAAEVLHEAEKELKQLPHGHMPLPAFWRLVEDTLQQAGAQLRTFTQAFETVTPGPVTQPLTPAEERKVLSLVSKHGPDKLYQVTSNVSGSKDLDLTLQRGQIVALLQRVDTKGNTSRWLVDAGGTASAAGRLSLPWHQDQKPNPNHFLSLGEGGSDQTQLWLPHLLHLPQVVAGFSFAARSPQEVSLQAGQPVVVLEPHDKKGSTEWSLVEVNGQRGYVPSSYLVTVPVQEPMGWSLPV
uniref:Rho guanine nucleotide exchange factor 37 n=1 Tax=Anser cygnoides TaxID=8845 RepID=A0A8B9DMD9_ANSCY